MAYSTIDKSTDNFNTVLYTGNGSLPRAITGVGYQPDFVWLKDRDTAYNHQLYDSVRGTSGGVLYSNTTAAADSTYQLSSFDSDGYTLGSNLGAVNENTKKIVGWNWKAGGTAPAITYVVKVVSDSGNKYRFDDFGTSAVTLDLQEGGTYTFDQADSSNSGHPLRFYTASDKSGGEYTTGVTTTGTPGSSGAKTVITVAASAPTLYYQCSSHAGMGGQANTNSTFGSSNFDGNKQSLVSANSTSGFSIIKYSGSGSSSTIGHGLSSAPGMILVKRTSGTDSWTVYHKEIGAGKYLRLDGTAAEASNSNTWANTTPTSTTFSVNHDDTNANGVTFIAYCFAGKTGYSKFGSYTGNGNANGTFVYTGFKPAFLMVKRSDGGTENWGMSDDKRYQGGTTNNAPPSANTIAHKLAANSSSAESSFGGAGDNLQDYLSNGFKFRDSNGYANASGATYIYMAFGQSIVGSNNVPATAR